MSYHRNSRITMLGLVSTVALLMQTGLASATPSTNIWNPNTDIQAPKVWHLGIDNYFSGFANRTRPTAFPTDLGLTYGLGSGFEVGIDLFEPSKNPVVFNAKWGTPESKDRPAFAIGIQSVGTNSETQGNIAYGLTAKTFGTSGRVTFGGYTGKRSFLGGEQAGVIAAWDKQLSPKWWASVDYASGNNLYGALSFGVSRQLTPNVGLIFGYVFYNNDTLNPNDTFTTQLDINF